MKYLLPMQIADIVDKTIIPSQGDMRSQKMTNAKDRRKYNNYKHIQRDWIKLEEDRQNFSRSNFITTIDEELATRIIMHTFRRPMQNNYRKPSLG